MNKTTHSFLKLFLGSTFGLTLLLAPALAQEVLPKAPPIPKNNPQNPAKIELGRKLYFDKRLSIDQTVSCNTCHNVLNGGSGTDNLQLSKGVKGQLGGRNAPTVWNSAFNSVQFWDGRAASLEEQAKGPLINPVEMAMPDHQAVVDRVAKDSTYVKEFQKAFKDKKPITIDRVVQAIASFERTLITPNSPVDLYLKGNKKALSESAVRGLKVFQTTGCISCHSGPNYAGPSLPEGTGFYMKFPTMPDTEYDKKYGFSKDLGRYDETKQDSDKHMFKVPTLRNVALTAPYFSNGSVQTLEEAVKVMAKTQLNKDLSHQEATDLVAFLNGLTGKQPKIKGE